MSPSNKTPCILQILPELESGGVERGAVDLSLYANRSGIRIVVASAGGRMVKILEKSRCEHITLPLATKNPLKILCNIFRLKNICLQENVKIIHARSRAPAWSAYFAAKLLNITFVTTFHGFYKNNFPLKKCYNSVMAKGKKVIAVSAFIRQHILDNYKTDEGCISIIHRGVDIAEFNPENITSSNIASFRKSINVPVDAPVMLLPGRITRWKGQDIAIKAMSGLEKDGAYLVIAGRSRKNDTYMNELVQLTARLGLEGKVRFVDDIQNMPLAYAASDIVLSTSIEPETFGRVSSEAGAMGKLVVATNHGGSVEIVADGKTGFLVPVGNSEELAIKIRLALSIISDEKTRQALAIDCRSHITERFSLQKMCESTLSIYKQLHELT